MEFQEEDVYDPDGYRSFHAFGPFIDKETFEIMPTTYVSLATMASRYPACPADKGDDFCNMHERSQLEDLPVVYPAATYSTSTDCIHHFTATEP